MMGKPMEEEDEETRVFILHLGFFICCVCFSSDRKAAGSLIVATRKQACAM